MQKHQIQPNVMKVSTHTLYVAEVWSDGNLAYKKKFE